MFRIKHSDNLKGTIQLSGSKNAALPIIAASYLSDKSVTLKNLPDIVDTKILQELGDEAYQISKDYYDLSSEKCAKIRASILLIPFGLVRYGKVVFAGTGGCKIGKRSLDTFDDALESCGVSLECTDQKIYTVTSQPQKSVVLKEFSVTTTEAVLTYLAFLESIDYAITIYQAAIEPHVLNLINFLKYLGADITINFDHSITVKPQKIQKQTGEFRIIGDYLEAGLFFGIGALADNSELTIKGCDVKELLAVFTVARAIGINYEIIDHETFTVNSRNKAHYEPFKIQTMIYPGFPTDLQSIFGVIGTQCAGVSKIFETLFEGRFAYLAQLENAGGKVEILNPHQALVIGPTSLRGNYLMSTDLRGGGAMIVAGIIASGETFITDEQSILRGYERIVEKLQSIGVKIENA